MEEQKPRIQSPQLFHHPLARLPYSENEYAPTPLEEDGNVVPMPHKNSITEDERHPRTSSKRKQRGVPGGKARTATDSKKTFKSVWQSQSTPLYPYADELKRLEDHAKRINQILADRFSKDAIADFSPNSTDRQVIPEASTPSAKWQVAQQPSQNPPVKNQWQSSPPGEAPGIETLKSQEHSIQKGLTELGLYLNEAGFLVSFAAAASDSNPMNSAQVHGQSPVPHPAVAPVPLPLGYPPTQVWEDAPSDPWDEEPPHTAKTEHSPDWGRGIAANRDLPRDRSRPHSSPLPTALRRHLRKLRGYLHDGRSLELPRQPIDRISDAALWVAVSAVVRVGSRYVLAAFPMLSPIFLVLILAPAMLAVYLAFCVPKAGWIPYYRLFLMMMGLLVGGKL